MSLETFIRIIILHLDNRFFSSCCPSSFNCKSSLCNVRQTDQRVFIQRGLMITIYLRHRNSRPQTRIFPVNMLLCNTGAPETLCGSALKPQQQQINSIYLNLLSSRSQCITFSCTHLCLRAHTGILTECQLSQGNLLSHYNLDLCVSLLICHCLHKTEMLFLD